MRKTFMSEILAIYFCTRYTAKIHELYPLKHSKPQVEKYRLNLSKSSFIKDLKKLSLVKFSDILLEFLVINFCKH